MANYFNTLPLRAQLAELGKCRFMHLDEFSDGVEALRGKKMVVIGCGAQGLNQGLNLRDSGLERGFVKQRSDATRGGGVRSSSAFAVSASPRRRLSPRAAARVSTVPCRGVKRCYVLTIPT